MSKEEKLDDKETSELFKEFMEGSIKAHESALQTCKDLHEVQLVMQKQFISLAKEMDELHATLRDIGAGSGGLKH